MSRSFYATRDDPYDSNRAALRPKLDVITAAMLTGGASGGWAVAEALKSRAARLIERDTSDADANAGEGSGGSQILPLPVFGRDIERVKREALS